MNKYIKFAFLFICSISFIIPNFINVKAASDDITNIWYPEPYIDNSSCWILSDNHLYVVRWYQEDIDWENTDSIERNETSTKMLYVTLTANSSGIKLAFNNLATSRSFYSWYDINLTTNSQRVGNSGWFNGNKNLSLTTSQPSKLSFKGNINLSSLSGTTNYHNIVWGDSSIDSYYLNQILTIENTLLDKLITIDSHIDQLEEYGYSTYNRILEIRNKLNDFYLLSYRNRTYDLDFGSSRRNSLSNDIQAITISDNSIHAYLYPYRQTNANSNYYYCLNVMTDGPRFSYADDRKISCNAYAQDGEHTIELNTTVGNVSGGGQSVLIFCEFEKNNIMAYPIYIEFVITGCENGTFNLSASNYYSLLDSNGLNSEEKTSINNQQSINNQFNQTTGQLDQIESSSMNNLNNSLQNINTNLDVLSNSDFIQTSNFVRSEMVNLFNIPQMQYVVMYSLILGFAFVIIGIKTRN